MFIPRRPSDFEFPKPKKRPPMPEVLPPKEEFESEDWEIIFLDNKSYIREEDVLKFYYSESEDDYYLGQRIDNFYYARYDKGCREFVWCMSKHLPWGERVTDKNTLWKEHTYPSEPIEIDFNRWLRGFIHKYYPENEHTPGITYMWK